MSNAIYFLTVLIVLFYQNSVFSSQNTAVAQINSEIIWSKDLAVIARDIENLNCLFGESSLLVFLGVKDQFKNLNHCAKGVCDASWLTKNHGLISQLIYVFKASQILSDRGGMLTASEKEKLLGKNIKGCGMQISMVKWSDQMNKLVNSEIVFQDYMLENGIIDVNNWDKKLDNSQNLLMSLKREIDNTPHNYFYEFK